MKNTRATFTLIALLFIATDSLLAQMPNWAFGAHTIMGLSGGIRQEATSPVVNGRLYDYSGKEELQVSYGIGLWLAYPLDSRWSIHATTSFQRVKVLANSTFVYDAPDLYDDNRFQSSWASQYLQLSLSGRYYFGEEASSNRWFVGAGMQGVFVYRHNYQSKVTFRYDPRLGPGFAFGGDGVVFSKKVIPYLEPDLEKSPLALAGQLELGLRIDRWSLSLVNTAFFQKRKEGVPSYDRYLTFSDPNPDGSITPSGVPLRYVRSATLHFACQIK
jgi:hypothetical protein